MAYLNFKIRKLSQKLKDSRKNLSP